MSGMGWHVGGWSCPHCGTQPVLDVAASQPDPFCTKPLVSRGLRPGEMVGLQGTHACGGSVDCSGSGAPWGCLAPWASRVGVPLLHQSRTLQALGKPFPRTLSDILWSSASRLGFVDGLSLSQATHSREMTVGIYITKEPGCFFLCAVRHGPWAVSPGRCEGNGEASPSLELVQLSTHRGEALGSPTSNRVWSGLLQTYRTCSPELVKPLER